MVQEKTVSLASALTEHPYNAPGWWDRGEEMGLFRASAHAGERAPGFTLPLLEPEITTST